MVRGAHPTTLFLKLDPAEVPENTPNYSNVTEIGHYGTGNVEFNISTEGDFEPIKEFILQAYNKLGG